MWRDAPKHQSPNAGWPESALAASLGVKFGGPRSYEGSRVDLPWMGEGRETLNRDDIRKGLRLYGTAMTFLLFLAVLLRTAFLSVSGRPAAMNTTSSATAATR